MDFPFNFADLKIIQDTGKVFSQISFCCFTVHSDQAEGLENRGRGKLDNLGLSSPDEINLTIRQTPSAAGKTAGTRRFCFLGYRE